jgi:hypothetical protein
VLNK